MRIISNRPAVLIALAALTLAASGSVSAQQDNAPDPTIVVNAPVLTKGPEIKGVITARNGERIKVTTADGDRKSTRLNSSHHRLSRMPSSA